MNSTLDVIFLVRDDAAHQKQLEHLAYLGFKIRACTELIEVYDNCAAHACPLVILSAPLADIHIAAARLRAIDRRVGIIAMEAFADSDSRIRTLLCGADACLPSDVSGLELAAVLQALLRRIVSLAPQPEAAELARGPEPGIDMGMEALALEPATAPPDAKWQLANQGWTLVSPGGRTLGLTTGEREFLSRLMRAPERKISREALIADDLSAPGGADQGAQRSRFVDVMISRLRRKAAHHQMPLPIRALHGWGYMFAAEVADEAGARGKH